MIDFPLVSVLMPVYNGEKYLKEAIESVLHQTYTNFEFIIVNDGSTDVSEQIILSYSDDRIVYLKNTYNLKLIQTLNLGFSKAKGKYIARMDADDISLPMRLEKQVEFLEKNPDIGVLGTGVLLKTDKETTELLYHTDDASIRFALAFYCPFIHPTVMLRKTIVDELPVVFDVNYVHAEDYELWTRLAHVTKLANLPAFLLEYRIHDNQISSQFTAKQTEMAMEIRKKYLTHYFQDEVDTFLFAFKLSASKKKLSNQLIELQRLYQLNQTHCFFGGNNLHRYIIQLWKELIVESNHFSINDFFRLLFCKITYKSPWTFRQVISIFAKTMT